jgi:hypothetical protein
VIVQISCDSWFLSLYVLSKIRKSKAKVSLTHESSCDLVTVKSFSGSDRDGEVKMLQQTQRPTFTAFLESFDFEGFLYVIFEYVPVSPAQIVVSPAYLLTANLHLYLHKLAVSPP